MTACGVVFCLLNQGPVYWVDLRGPFSVLLSSDLLVWRSHIGVIAVCLREKTDSAEYVEIVIAPSPNLEPLILSNIYGDARLMLAPVYGELLPYL